MWAIWIIADADPGIIHQNACNGSFSNLCMLHSAYFVILFVQKTTSERNKPIMILAILPVMECWADNVWTSFLQVLLPLVQSPKVWFFLRPAGLRTMFQFSYFACTCLGLDAWQTYHMGTSPVHHKIPPSKPAEAQYLQPTSERNSNKMCSLLPQDNDCMITPLI